MIKSKLTELQRQLAEANIFPELRADITRALDGTITAEQARSRIKFYVSEIREQLADNSPADPQADKIRGILERSLAVSSATAKMGGYGGYGILKIYTVVMMAVGLSWFLAKYSLRSFLAISIPIGIIAGIIHRLINLAIWGLALRSSNAFFSENANKELKELYITGLVIPQKELEGDSFADCVYRKTIEEIKKKGFDINKESGEKIISMLIDADVQDYFSKRKVKLEYDKLMATQEKDWPLLSHRKYIARKAIPIIRADSRYTSMRTPPGATIIEEVDENINSKHPTNENEDGNLGKDVENINSEHPTNENEKVDEVEDPTNDPDPDQDLPTEDDIKWLDGGDGGAVHFSGALCYFVAVGFLVLLILLILVMCENIMSYIYSNEHRANMR